MSGEDAFQVLSTIVARANEIQEVRQKIANWDKVFQFKPGDAEPFILQATNGVLNVSKGLHPNPTATLEASHQDLLAMMKGELDPVKAFFSGRLKIKGDVFATQELNSILQTVQKK